jgi:hypothetical protein
MATGFYYDSTNFKWVPLSEQWNGTAWTLKTAIQPAGATMSWFYGVSCVSATACTAVGDKEINAGTHQHQTMAQRWNGTSWSLQTTPNPEGTNLEFSNVSCTSSVFCTGTGHAVSGGISTPMALRWDGSTWTLQMLPLPSGATGANTYSNGVSCILSRGCQMVGQYTNASSVIVPLAEANWRSAAPTVTTTAATSIGEKTATIKGTVNPNGSETKAYFEYGTTTSYGSKTAEINVGSGSSAVEASAALTGLNPGTVYHYRAVASNENPETSRGTDLTFTTTALPVVSTSSAEVDAGGEAATLRGQVNPKGSSTTYQFEYGTSPGVYPNTVPAIAESAGSGTEAVAVSYKVTGLTRGKTYYYRITASNSVGKSDGSQVSFTTPDQPGVTTAAATGVTRRCATLNGTVTPNGLTTKYWFEYGTTTSYGTNIPVTPKELPDKTSPRAVSETICSLPSKTTYHYRLRAENSIGAVAGSDVTFTTLGLAALEVEGKFLEGGPMEAVSSNLTINGSHCPEVEFNGKVKENPGARQLVSTAKLQSGAAGCPIGSGLELKLQKGIQLLEEAALEYGANGAGEIGVSTTPEFNLLATAYYLGSKVGECEYDLTLFGMSEGGAPLEPTLAGKMERIKGSFLCLPSLTVSGKFAITNEGKPVEASPWP